MSTLSNTLCLKPLNGTKPNLCGAMTQRGSKGLSSFLQMPNLSGQLNDNYDKERSK